MSYLKVEGVKSILNDYLLGTSGKIINKYNTKNSFVIAKAMNIEVLYYDLGKLKGFYPFLIGWI